MTSADSPLVSCLCVTRQKPQKLRRAVACFLAQSYPNKELVIVYETDDRATMALLEEYRGRDGIRCLAVDVNPKKSLGQLRNFAIQSSRGEYFCQWDDDDWYHVDRVSEQLAAVSRNCQSASVLTNWIMYDSLRERAYFSGYRLWEGSILCRSDVLTQGIAYPDLPRMEDGFFVNDLVDRSRVYPLARPELYVYEVHATNTWNRRHFDMLFSLSQPLPTRVSQMVRTIMSGECDVIEASRWMSSPELLGELRYFYVNNFTQSPKQLERYRLEMLAHETPGGARVPAAEPS